MSDPDKRPSGRGEGDNGAGVAITFIKWISIIVVVAIVAYVVLRVVNSLNFL